MKKTLLFIMFILTLCTIGYFGYQYFFNQSNPQENNTSLNIKRSNSSTSNSMDETTEQATEQTTEQTDSTEKNNNIDTEINNIARVIKKFNQFANASMTVYNSNVDELLSYNVTVDNNTVKGPFGIFDPLVEGINQSTVLSGIVIEQKVERDGNDYIITNISRTAQSQAGDNPANTGSYIMDELKKDEYSQYNRDVKYKLVVSENRLDAQLIRISEQWW